jgi:thioredoxin-like negative regulator of GroEL
MLARRCVRDSQYRRTALVLIGVVAIAGTGASTAHADASPISAKADALFREGTKLRDAGKIPEACSKFARSKELAPGVGISLHLADCYERMGRGAAALEEFTRAETAARERGDPRADVAAAHAQALRGKLGADPTDALFEDAKRLRDTGKVEEACSKFAQSQALAPGVGITLHLADCFQRLGLTASAWTEFRIAEKEAHERSDKREGLARARALLLEPKVQRLTIVVPDSVPQDGGTIQLDGRTVPPATWNLALAIDPGSHLVTFEAPGVERRTFPVSLDASVPAAIVRIDAVVAAAAASSPGSAGALSAPVAEAPPSASPPSNPAEVAVTRRRWIEIGLLGGAALAAGVGASLLAVKNGTMSNGGANRAPYVDPVVTAGSKVSFAVAGGAAAAAIVVYLTAPKPKDAGLSVTVAPVAGGGGALLSGSF